MAEELIAFPSKAEMLARSRQFWNPDKTQFLDRLRRPAGHRPARGVLHLRRLGQAPDRRAPQRGDLQPGPPQPRGHRGGQRGHAALRHRQPPLPVAGAHGPGRGADQHRTARPGQSGVRQRRWRGHRHRTEDRPARHPETPDRLGGQGLPRAHRPGRRDRRRAVRDPVPGRPAGRVHPCPVSTTWPRWKTRCAAGTSRR